jgi:hypothetical protein
MPATVTRLLASFFAGALVAASLSAQTVFTTDFESGVPPELTPGAAAVTGVQSFGGFGARSTFGGSFLRSPTGNVVTLTLANLPPHDVVHLDFLFAAIDSLDGAGSYPQGDYFRVTVDGVTLFREAFANALISQVQTYVSPLGVELARHLDLGFSGPGSFYTDSAYDLGADALFASISHSSGTLTVEFVIEGPGIQSLNDESWALENLSVHVGFGTIGTVAAYGMGCGPVLAATSVPGIGQNLGLQLSALPASTVHAFFAIGLSSGQYGSFVLPLPLDGYGLPGCWLLQDLGLSSALPLLLGNGVATGAIAVPTATGLVGLQLYLQGWVVTPGVNARGILFSNGLRARVGS